MSGERGMGVKKDVNLLKEENDEFPILCETCLGNNPYVRMVRIPYGGGCKSCGRPFTIFRWKAGVIAMARRCSSPPDSWSMSRLRR